MWARWKDWKKMCFECAELKGKLHSAGEELDNYKRQVIHLIGERDALRKHLEEANLRVDGWKNKYADELQKRLVFPNDVIRGLQPEQEEDPDNG